MTRTEAQSAARRLGSYAMQQMPLEQVDLAGMGVSYGEK
jgi:hypothetical protein